MNDTLSFNPEEINIGVVCDMHIHLREGEMMRLVTPKIRDGGVSIVYVMPNISSPIDSYEKIVAYKTELERLSPTTTFFMSLYLTKNLTIETLRKCKAVGFVLGVKLYPLNVTTSSESGIDLNNIESFYHIFSEMQKLGLVLNLHGEDYTNRNNNLNEINVLNAEINFLPILNKLINLFPKLKIVLEHCTTKESLNFIRSCNKDKSENDEIYVSGSITAHHLMLTLDDWAGSPINFCKPVPKLASDCRALVEAATSGERYFFFGSDSAPHDTNYKSDCYNVKPGIFTLSHALIYLAEVFYKESKLLHLKSFASTNSLNFYRLKSKNILKNYSHSAFLVYKKTKIPDCFVENNLKLIPFMNNSYFSWSVFWKSNLIQ